MPNKAFFVGDHPALDFLNTIAAPRGEIIEFIPDGGAYVAWLAAAALLEKSDAKELLGKFGKSSLNRVADEARHLREWFRQEIPELIGTRGMTADVVEKLNRILANDQAHHQLSGFGNHLILRERHKVTEAQQLLVPIVQKIAELLTSTERLLIKRCANPSCTLWFYDRTKAHRRLFCSAAVCGNRAKVAAYRKRQQQSQ